MKSVLHALLAGVPLALGASPSFADDLEGAIDAIDRSQSSFTVQGIQFFITGTTDFDEGLKGFDSLQQGQRVEVDFEYRDNRHFATEVELDD